VEHEHGRYDACGMLGYRLDVGVAESKVCTSFTANSGTSAAGYGVTLALRLATSVTYFKTLSASATAAGALSKAATFLKTLAASATAAGALAKVVTFVKTLAASASATGAMTRIATFLKTLAASATATGTLARKQFRILAATATATGTMTLARKFLKTLAASATAAGAIARVLTRALSLGASVTATAVLGKYRAYGAPFLFTSANWGTQSFYLEVYLRATSGTVLARLYDRTAGAVVASSEVNTASTSFVRLRSAALTLVNGSEYEVQFGAAGSGAGAFRSAKVIAA